jgi:myosin heavy subunit
MNAKIESSQLTRRRPIPSSTPTPSASSQSPIRLRDMLRNKTSLDTSALSSISNTHGLSADSFSYSSPAKQANASPSSLRRTASPPVGVPGVNDSTSVKQLLKLASEIEVLKRDMSELRVENHQHRFKHNVLNDEITQLKQTISKLEYEKTNYENIIKSLENERDEYQELVIQSSDALKLLQHKNMQLVAAYNNADALKDKEIQNLRKSNHELVKCIDEYKTVVFNMPHSVRTRGSAKKKANQSSNEVAAPSIAITRIQPSNEEQLLDLDNINELILKVETLIDLNAKDSERQKGVEQSLRVNIDNLIDQIELSDCNRRHVESYLGTTLSYYTHTPPYLLTLEKSMDVLPAAVDDAAGEYVSASQRFTVDAIWEEDLSSDT